MIPTQYIPWREVRTSWGSSRSLADYEIRHSGHFVPNDRSGVEHRVLETKFHLLRPGQSDQFAAIRKSCINPHHTVNTAQSCICSQISCGPSLLHMEQLCLCKSPFTWTLAASVYITPRTNIFRVTFSIKFQNSTLVYPLTSYKTSILEACKLSLLCRTIQIAVSGMASCKLLRANMNSSDETDMKPHAFNILLWRTWSSRCFALLHISTFLKLLNWASNRLANWKNNALQCCNGLAVGQPNDAQCLLLHHLATVLTECATGTPTAGWERTALAYKVRAKRCVRTCGRKLYELRNTIQEISLFP